MHALMCWEAIVCWIYSHRLPGGSAVECFLLFEQRDCANLGKGRRAQKVARAMCAQLRRDRVARQMTFSFLGATGSSGRRTRVHANAQAVNPLQPFQSTHTNNTKPQKTVAPGFLTLNLSFIKPSHSAAATRLLNPLKVTNHSLASSNSPLNSHSSTEKLLLDPFDKAWALPWRRLCLWRRRTACFFPPTSPKSKLGEHSPGTGTAGSSPPTCPRCRR